MATRLTTVGTGSNSWVKLGAVAAILGVVAVLAVQALATALRPEIALFRPLDNYARTVLFTLVPAIGATLLFRWLAAHRPRPVADFVKISAVVLLLSIIPDYALPVPNKTLPASSVTALLHVVAALVIVTVLVRGYRREIRPEP